MRLRLFFGALLVALFAQLPVRHLLGEPYPAVLMPAGAGLVSADDEFVASALTVVAVDARGIEHPVDVGALLRDVPSLYHKFVLARGFGLLEGRDVRRQTVPWLGVEVSLGRPLTAAQEAETREWLRREVERLTGAEPRRIVIVRHPIRATDHAPGTPIARVVELLP